MHGRGRLEGPNVCPCSKGNHPKAEPPEPGDGLGVGKGGGVIEDAKVLEQEPKKDPTSETRTSKVRATIGKRGPTLDTLKLRPDESPGNPAGLAFI